VAKIKSFTLKEFKGVEELTIDLTGRVDCPVTTLIGLNESGKTTILEGLSHFVTGDKTVSSLFDAGSSFDATTLIPIHKKAAFTGVVEVSALVAMDDADYEAASLIASKMRYEIDKSVLCEDWKISRRYHFVDSKKTKVEKADSIGRCNTWLLNGL
jgi:predicted ATP-dependent endonuclease of OLD family